MTGAQLKGLGSRAIIGAFNKRLEEVGAASWIPSLALQTTSNQDSETYKFLSDAPAMQEKQAGGYATKTPRDFDFSVVNKRFGASIAIDEDDFRRDKTGQIRVRINELAARAAQLPQKLITTLLNNGGAGLAYDGVAFFGTHTTLSGATVDNAIDQTAATGTTPTNQEMESGILAAVEAILGFLDDEGEPRNEFAQQFAVMVPPNMWKQASAALRNDFVAAGTSNALRASGFSITPIMNPRLSSAVNMFVFRTDADVKSFVWQDEVPAYMQMLGEGSDHHTINDERVYFAKRVCNAGYGRFDQAVRVTFT